MKELLTREVDQLTVSPQLQQMEARMAKEYEPLAIKWTDREKQEEIERAAQREQSNREYEEWKKTHPDRPLSFLEYSNPPSVEPSPEPSPKTDDRIIREIEKLHEKLLETGAGIDIGGTWRIDCPKISSWYGTGRNAMCHNTDITWIIHSPQPSKSYVWVQISEVIVEGIARIEWPEATNWKGKTRAYVWRGRDTGTGEIQFQDNINCGTIVFTSSHECSGTFACEFGGPYPFVGRKVSRGFPAQTNSVEESKKEFHGYNERRWNSECSSRWGGGRGYYDSEEDMEENEEDEDEEEPPKVMIEGPRKPERVSMEARGIAAGMNKIEEGRRKPKRPEGLVFLMR